MWTWSYGGGLHAQCCCSRKAWRLLSGLGRYSLERRGDLQMTQTGHVVWPPWRRCKESQAGSMLTHECPLSHTIPSTRHSSKMDESQPAHTFTSWIHMNAQTIYNTRPDSETAAVKQRQYWQGLTNRSWILETCIRESVQKSTTTDLIDLRLDACSLQQSLQALNASIAHPNIFHQTLQMIYDIDRHDWLATGQNIWTLISTSCPSPSPRQKRFVGSYEQECGLHW